MDSYRENLREEMSHLEKTVAFIRKELGISRIYMFRALRGKTAGSAQKTGDLIDRAIIRDIDRFSSTELGIRQIG